MAKACLLQLVFLSSCVPGGFGASILPERAESDVDSRLRQLETQVQNFHELLSITHLGQRLKRDVSPSIQKDMVRRQNHLIFSQRQAPEVGFHVQLQTSKAFYKDQILKFDQAISRIGNAYDMNTGVFTCVEPGTYMFSMNIVSGHYSYIEAAIMKNGGAIMKAVSENKSGQVSDQGGGMTILQLQPGDKVSVNIIYVGNDVKGTVYGNGLSSFVGYLLRPH